MEIYEKLYREAIAAFQRGEPQIDPHLSDKSRDLRRGVTIVSRPSTDVRDRVKAYLDHLTTVYPGQHFYQPEELHVTVLSIISGTEHWQKEIQQLDAYRAVIRAVLCRQRAFSIVFRGVTATPGSVMIQGFSAGDALNKIRDELRVAFANAGFVGVLDRRYTISTAHMTAMRFRQPMADCNRLMSLLEEGRRIDFDEMEVSRLQLIWGDWYASAGITRTLEEYQLSG